MFQKGSAFSDTFEQLGQTVKQAGQQAVKVPKDLLEIASGQVKGQTAGDGTGGQQASVENLTKAGSAQQQFKQQMTPEQELEIKKKQEAQKSMAKYKQIQEELQRYRKRKAQETPAYAAGQPGAPKDKEEEMDLWEKQEKEAKEKKKKEGIKLPGDKGPVGTGEKSKRITG